MKSKAASVLMSLWSMEANSCLIFCLSGELLGHRDLVSGFSFCHHPAQTQLCASASHDGTIRFWDSDSRSFLKEHAAHQVRTDLSFDHHWRTRPEKTVTEKLPLSALEFSYSHWLVSFGQKPVGLWRWEGNYGLSLVPHWRDLQLLPRTKNHLLP